MPTLTSGLRISSHQLGPDETPPQTHRGPHGPSMIRSVKRAIVDIRGIHPIFALCSFTDVRDGFARDCPHRHPVLPMLALRDRSRVAPDFLVGFRRFQRSRAQRRGGESRLGQGGGRGPRDRLAGRGRWSGVRTFVASYLFAPRTTTARTLPLFAVAGPTRKRPLKGISWIESLAPPFGRPIRVSPLRLWGVGYRDGSPGAPGWRV